MFNKDQYVYGIDSEIKDKINSRWKLDDAKEALIWIKELTQHPISIDDASAEGFQEALKDGQALCKLANALSPGACPRINTMKMPFMQRENIVAYLDWCKKYGVKDINIFATIDLFEANNLVSVLDNIYIVSALAKKNNFSGRTIGVKVANETTDSKFEVKATGSTAVQSRWTSGSAGFEDKRENVNLRYHIVKTADAGSSEISQQTSGSVNTATTANNASYHTSIIKQ